MSYQNWRPRCAICQQSVDLTESKTDECGRAVHENCYISLLIRNQRGLTMPIDALRLRERLMNCDPL